MRTRLLRDSQIAARLALRDIPRHFYDNTEAPVSLCCRFRLLDLLDLALVVVYGALRVNQCKLHSMQNDDEDGSSERVLRPLLSSARMTFSLMYCL